MYGLFLLAMTAAPPIVPPPPPIIEAYPATATAWSGTIRCFSNQPVTISLEDAHGSVVLNYLTSGSAILDAEKRERVNKWLRTFVALDTASVKCNSEGALITVYGRRSLGSGDITRIDFAWAGNFLVNYTTGER